MIQEDRELLLKDLCARLPYNVICSTVFGNCIVLYIDIYEGTIYIPNNEWVYDFKPYLRPMSSMTDEEKHYIDYEWGADNDGDITTYSSCEGGMSIVECACIVGFQDWLNKKMFDYRGLIEKGLAIEAPKDIYEH